MASRHDSTKPTETDAGMDEAAESLAAGATLGLAAEPASVGLEWANDDGALLGEILASHGFGADLTRRLVELATTPTHIKRPVDRLAVALGAHFDFLALDGVWTRPVLLCGLPGAGTSTLVARMAARFDDSEVALISAGTHGDAKTAWLAECLEALDLPLTHAADAAALNGAVAAAGARKVIIDLAAAPPFDGARAASFIRAAGATGILVLSGETTPADARAAARTASDIGIGHLIATHFDVARYLGGILNAADAAKLTLLGATVTPHFGFGFRALSPENLARRLIAASHAERWRAAPL